MKISIEQEVLDEGDDPVIRQHRLNDMVAVMKSTMVDLAWMGENRHTGDSLEARASAMGDRIDAINVDVFESLCIQWTICACCLASVGSKGVLLDSFRMLTIDEETTKTFLDDLDKKRAMIGFGINVFFGRMCDDPLVIRGLDMASFYDALDMQIGYWVGVLSRRKRVLWVARDVTSGAFMGSIWTVADGQNATFMIGIVKSLLFARVCVTKATSRHGRVNGFTTALFNALEAGAIEDGSKYLWTYPLHTILAKLTSKHGFSVVRQEQFYVVEDSMEALAFHDEQRNDVLARAKTGMVVMKLLIPKRRLDPLSLVHKRLCTNENKIQSTHAP